MSSRRASQPLTRAVTRTCSCNHQSKRQALTFRSSRALSTSSSASTQPAPLPVAETPTPTTTVELLTDLRHLLRRYPLLHETGWEHRVEKALADLQKPRKARIAVIGEKSTGVSSLVTAAFDDPLAAEADASVALASRRLNDAPEAIALTFADKVKTSSHELALPVGWLRANSTELIEIAHGDPPPLQSSLDAVYASDSVVLLLSEVLSLSPKNTQRLLLQLAGKPNLFVVVNALDPCHTAALETLHFQLESLLRTEDQPKVHVVSTELAVEGLQALRPDDPNAPVSFDKFQKSYIQSGIPSLKDKLARSVANISQPASEAGAASELQVQTAAYIVDKVLGVSAAEGAEIEYLLSRAEEAINGLVLEGEETAASVLQDLGVVDGALKVPSGDVAEAKAAFETLLNGRITWWKLPGRTDDITTEVAIVADDAYLRKFEDQLIFNTGRLIGLTSTMSKKTDQALQNGAFLPNTRPLASLYSPLLLNRIEQASLEAGRISTTDLSAPLVSRRNQITGPGGPSEVLQRRAQKAVVSSATLSASSIAAAIASHLTEYAELATNVGFGLFGTALSAWLLQRGWYKAQKKFFVDVEHRVTGGVEADLAAAAHRIIDRSLYKSRTAVAGVKQLLNKRQTDYRAFASELRRIDRARPPTL